MLLSQEPVVGELDRKFFKFGFLICCRSEPLSINARLPGGGRYVPGQTIYVNLEVDNRSDQDVTAFTVQLISVSEIHCKYVQLKLIIINFENSS